MAKDYFGVVFDMDAVFVNSWPVIVAAAVKGLGEYGIEARNEDFAQYIGSRDDLLIESVACKYGLPYSPHIRKRVFEIYNELVPELLHVYDGIPLLLQKLKKDGWHLGLVSIGYMPRLEANLTTAGIEKKVFSAITTGEEIERQKPYPEIYLKTADKLKLLPYSCISVENSPNGINAAKRSGMQCIAVANTIPEDELAREIPDHVCKQLKDVYDLVKNNYL